MINSIKNLTTKDYIFLTLHVITLVTVFAAIVIAVGWSSVIVSSLTTLITVGSGIIAALIALKNYEASEYDRRKNYLLKYFLDKTQKLNNKSFTLPNSGIEVYFDAKNYPIQGYQSFSDIMVYYQLNIGEVADVGEIKPVHVDTNRFYQEYKDYLLYINSGLKYILKNVVNKIISEKGSLPNKYIIEILEICLNEFFLGYIRSHNEALDTTMYYFDRQEDMFIKKDTHYKLLERMMLGIQEITEGFGEFAFVFEDRLVKKSK